MPKQSNKHIAIYVRVSTRSQDHKSQEPDLERWAKSADGPIKWYRDTGSGKTMNRPGWNKLEDAMRVGKVLAIVVWRLDRLGRTAKELTALFDELPKRKVNLVSLKDGLDLSTPAGRLMANVLASVAQYETEVRGERVLAGQEKAKAKGKQWGGSAKGKRKRLKPAEIRTIHRMKAEGETITAIAKTVKRSRQTIYDVLNSVVQSSSD